MKGNLANQAEWTSDANNNFWDLVGNHFNKTELFYLRSTENWEELQQRKSEQNIIYTWIFN